MQQFAKNRARCFSYDYGVYCVVMAVLVQWDLEVRSSRCEASGEKWLTQRISVTYHSVVQFGAQRFSLTIMVLNAVVMILFHAPMMLMFVYNMSTCVLLCVLL